MRDVPGVDRIAKVVIANTNGGRGVAYPKLINCQVGNPIYQ